MEGGHVTEAEQIEILYPSGYSKWFKWAYQTQDMLIRYNHSYSWEFCISNQKDMFFLIFIYFYFFSCSIWNWKDENRDSDHCLASCHHMGRACLGMKTPHWKSLAMEKYHVLMTSSDPLDLAMLKGVIFQFIAINLFFAHSVSSWIFWRVKFYKFSCKDGTRINH